MVWDMSMGSPFFVACRRRWTGNMSAQFTGSMLPKHRVVFYGCGKIVVGNISGHRNFITCSMLLPQQLEWLQSVPAALPQTTPVCSSRVRREQGSLLIISQHRATMFWRVRQPFHRSKHQGQEQCKACLIY